MRNLSSNIPFGKNTTFQTAVVVEFIGNPEEFFQKINSSGQKNIDLLKTKTFNNSQIAEHIPHGSIIAINSNPIKTRSNKLEIYFPFFPTHLSLPVKPGEKVWIYNDAQSKIGYWMCRKPASLIAEDLNYTQLDRIIDYYDYITNPEAKNEDLVTFLSQGGTSGGKNLPQGVTYDAIVSESKSYADDHIGEAVPRYPQKCSDFIMQGSNNSLIKLSHEGKEKSGNIAIIAGRGQTSETDFATIKNVRGASAKSLEYDETDKTLRVKGLSTNLMEGADDLINDITTIKASMLSNPEDELGIDISALDDVSADSNDEKGTVLLRSDQILITSRADGSIKLVQENVASGASIVIDKDGNIQIKAALGKKINLGAGGVLTEFVRYDALNIYITALHTALKAFGTACSPPIVGVIAAGNALNTAVSSTLDNLIDPIKSNTIKGE